MADLRSIQNVQPVEAARLQQVPTPSPAPSSAATFASAGSALAGGVSAFSRAFAGAKKAEAEAGESAFVGTLTDKLIKAQQAGKTNPKFDSAAEQRKIVQKAIADNPQYSALGIKAFKDITGNNVAGVSFEEEQRLEMQEEAWSNGYGSPDADEEVNAKQLELYRSQQRTAQELSMAMQELNFKEAKRRVSDKEKKDVFVKQTTKLADNEFQSTLVDMEADLKDLKAGKKTIAQLQQEWALSKIQLGNTLNQLGEMKNDEDIQALLQPTMELYELAEKSFSGQFDIEGLQGEIDLRSKKMEALVTADPKSLRAATVFKLYGHAPGLSSIFAKHATELLNADITDLRSFDSDDLSDFQSMIDNGSKDPQAADAAAEAQGKVVNHFSRNGMDYSDEEKLDVIKALNTPEVWNKMSPEQRQEAMGTFETYVVDVVDNVVRDSLKQEIVTSEFQGVTGFREASVETVRKPITEFATLVVDDAGIRYELKPNITLSRQIRTKVISANKELATKVNPALSVMSGASGLSREDVATRYLGVTLGDEEDASESLTGASGQVSDSFKDEFIKEAIEAGSSEEEAQELWDSVNSPATDEVDIGGVKMSRERARQILSAPAQ